MTAAAKEPSSKRTLRLLLASLGLLVLIFALLLRAAFRTEATGTEIPLDRLERLATNAQVLDAKFLDQEAKVVGHFCPSNALALKDTGTPDPAGCQQKIESFQTAYPGSDATTEALIDRLSATTVADASQQIPLDQLDRLAAAAQVANVKFWHQKTTILGRFCPSNAMALDAAGKPDPASCQQKLASFQTPYPGSNEATKALMDDLSQVTVVEASNEPYVRPGAPVTVDSQTTKQVLRLLVTFVMPLLILANLFALIFMPKTGDSSMSEVVGFGRFNRRRQREKASENAVTFADVAGAGHAVTELAEVIDYLKDPTRFQAIGASAPRGVILFGPPGTGKTLLARAVAGESGVPFVSVSGTEFVESLVGVGAARVRDLFSQVRDLAPAICFVDEIDALGRKREGEGTSGGEREQTLNQLLVEMDGFDPASGIVVIAATNRPDILDSALMRPGRFDRHITLEPPDLQGRRDVLTVHAKRRPLAPDVDLDQIATRTPGFTGADLANVLNEAALLTVRQQVPGEQIGMAQIAEAIQRVLHGPHRGTILTPAERTRIAVHEAGHAVVATAVGLGSDVHRVSLVARSRAVGTTSVGTSDKVLHTVPELEDQLAMALAGTAAEDAVLGSISTTSEDDVQRASAIARDMVGLYGMSGSIGRVKVLSRQVNFLGDDGVHLEAVSAATVAAFDGEVRKLVEAAEVRAKQIIGANVRTMDAMVQRLQAEETLEGPALVQLLAPVEPEPNAKGNGNRRQGVSARAAASHEGVDS